MRLRILIPVALLIAAAVQGSFVGTVASQAPDASTMVRRATVDGLSLQYLEAGRGPTVVLLHGYTETSRMWRPLIPRLADRFHVIAPDLPGIGGSDIPTDDVTLSMAARRIHGLVKSLRVDKATVVGHDIGLMVAYAYAAQFHDETDGLVLMDAFLPGVDGWKDIYDNPQLWHFRFHGATPERLVSGREREYFDYYWNEFAAERHHSIPDADRRAYTDAYARPGRMRAAWAYFASFPQAADEFARFAKTPLRIPVLSIGGAKANGEALGRQAKLIASTATSLVLPETGHWLMEERPTETVDALMHFLSNLGGASTTPQLRLTPDEIRATDTRSDAIGSSGLQGVTTRVLAGDPSRGGLYTIALFVPAHTTIPAHSHRDDRTATVISGQWQFGYGDRFGTDALKTLPPGSVYSEPAGANHFARTLDEPALVEITGVGPTDTKYVEATNVPKTGGERRP
ncbi:MAG TPA: alpha/beta fold hydrolase [Vicinamibacterales bacterium]|jgi:pimeloyl-ACP methyl ester carboxylesterase/quercetin dioxygenase-like cupin family protein